MLKRLARLFQIRTRFEAMLVIYALAIGAVQRGSTYLQEYPGAGGYMLFLACTAAVFVGGAKILDSVRPPTARTRESDRRGVERRQLSA